MPKVTICIPAYNAAATIGETLESVLGQTYLDREVVVSDNHSTDGTREVVAGFAGRGVRLVTCPEPPVKTGSLLDNCVSGIQNWNSLPDVGTGEYVGIYHADDVYDPGLLERQVEALERRPGSSAAFTTTRAFDVLAPPAGTLGPAAGEGEAEEWFDQLALVRRMLRIGHNVSSSGPLVRRVAWRKAGRLDALTFEQAVDTDFWIRLAGVGPIAVLRPAMVRYRVHPGQDTARRHGLYRYRPDPFVKVLEHWVSAPGIRERLDARDLDLLAARRSVEDLRIALIHSLDDQPEEAGQALERFPAIGRALALAFGVERDRWHVGVARALSASLLGLALKVGASRQVAALIVRSRPSLREWA